MTLPNGTSSTTSPTEPLVSVILPAYNAAPWIEETLASLSGQTRTDFELLVGDDGSTDGTLTIIQRAAAADSRIIVLALPHSGVVATRNALIKRARGKYIMFHDADDVSSPWRMEAQVSFLEGNPSFVAVSSKIVKFHGAYDHASVARPPDLIGSTECVFDIRPFAYHRKKFAFGACMVLRSAVLQLGGFRPYFYQAEDADFVYRLSEKGRLAVLDATLLHYRQHHANTSRRAPYCQTESSVLSRVIALRRRAGRPDTCDAAKTPFLRIFTSGLTAGEITQTAWLLTSRLASRYIRNLLHRP